MEEAGSVGVKSTKLACRRRFLASALLAPGAGPGHAGPEGWDALRACGLHGHSAQLPGAPILGPRSAPGSLSYLIKVERDRPGEWLLPAPERSRDGCLEWWQQGGQKAATASQRRTHTSQGLLSPATKASSVRPAKKHRIAPN